LELSNIKKYLQKSEQNNGENLEKLAAQIQGKFQASDDIDLRLKEAVEKNFNDTILCQRVIEMVTQLPQTQLHFTAPLKTKTEMSIPNSAPFHSNSQN
jgi:hypothetical protein